MILFRESPTLADQLAPLLCGLAADAARHIATALARQMMLRNSAPPDPLSAHKVDSLAIFYASLADGKEGVAAFREKRAPQFTAKASQMPPFYPWW